MVDLLNADQRWWLADEESDLARLAYAAAQEVDQYTSERREQILDAYCLYGDSSALGAFGDAFERVAPGGISRNVIASATDTVVSEVTQTTPRPMFVTVGGNWLEQERARKLTYHCDAEFDECDVRPLAEQVTRDAVIAGLGILRPYIDPQTGTRVLVERIFPANLIVDDRNAIDVLPRCWYVRHLVDRWHLAELYPNRADAIRHARVAPGAWFADAARTKDMVEVIEAIHLPSREDKSDGRRVLVLTDAVLVDEPHKWDDPGMCFIRAVKPIRGFWGGSLVHRAAPTQTELNKLLRRVQDSMHLHATAIWFVQRQARIVKSHIVNNIGAIAEYDGNVPPQQHTPTSMSGEVYAYIEALEQRIYKLMGVSELSASSLKPKGLDSGRALQVYNDVQSRRFISLERDFEGLFTELARQFVRLETMIAEEHPEHEVIYADGCKRERIQWREIDLERDRFRVRVFPASAFPTNPAAKIQMLQDMLGSGVIDQQGFYELALDVPDLESVRNRIVAPLELLHKRFSKMLYTAEYLAPEPYMDLELGLKECALALQRAELDECPEERLDLLRQWLADAEHILSLAAPPANDVPPMPGALVPPETLPGMPPGPMPPPGMPPAPMMPPQAA